MNDDVANFQVFDNYAFDVKVKPSFLGTFVPAGTGYWTGSAGNPVTINPSANYRYMAFLTCTPGQRVKLSGFYTPKSGIGICVYVDASGDYLSRKESGSDFATGKYDFVVPDNCTQLGIYFLTTGGFAWPIENATIQVGDFEATLNPDCLSKDLTTIPPRVESLEEINNFCYKTKEQKTINFVSIGIGYWNGTVGEPVIVSSSAT